MTIASIAIGSNTVVSSKGLRLGTVTDYLMRVVLKTSKFFAYLQSPADSALFAQPAVGFRTTLKNH